MKVVQLGCGITGRVCAEFLEKNPNVDELILADRFTDAAESMAKRVRSDKISVVKTDVSDKDALRKLLKGKDVVVCSLTFEMLEVVAEEAIRSGVNYVDFSMTSMSLEDMEKMEKGISDSGITYLTAMGADPGLTDVFARRGANLLDSVHEARVRDGDNGFAEGYPYFSLWSPMDMVDEATMPAAVFRDGKIEYLPPLHKKEMYEFPPPVGPLPVYNTTHEETFLIPRFIKGIKNADFKIGLDDDFVAASNMIRKIGMHSKEFVDVKGVKVRPLDVVAQLMPRPVDFADKVKGDACILVEMLGKKDGKDMVAKVWAMASHEEAYRLCKSNATGFLVGVGGAVGTEMILSGELKSNGLTFPEQLPAEKVIARLPDKHVQVKEELVPLK